jgi:hypothetical protein
MAILHSIHSPRDFEVEICSFSEVSIDFNSEYMYCTERLSRSQGASRTTGGVEDSTVFIDEHAEEVAQDWLGFRRHVLSAICWSSIRIGDAGDNFSIPSSTE